MAEQASDEGQKRISIIKIYVKDFSFESPQSPGVFQASEWKPSTNLNLRSATTKLDKNLHEVVLTITVEAKSKDDDKTLFLTEIQQAGVFELVGYNEQEMSALVGSFTPNILFPYAREAIANMVSKGGFPEFVLQPINFDALYMQSLQQQQANAEVKPEAKPETH